MVKIPKKVADRFIKELGGFQKVLETAKSRDVNEADTVTIVTDMLATVFGYDKYTEVTGEYAIRGTFCDLAVRIDGKVNFLIEVKAIGIELKDNHLRQAISYGASEGIPWIVLTNGIRWQVYKLKFDKAVEHELICECDILQMNARRLEDQVRLFLLCKEGMSKAAIEVYQRHVESVNEYMIGAVILSDEVMDLVRRQLKKASPGAKINKDEIQKILINNVIKRGVLEGDAAAKAKSRVTRATSRALRKIKAKSGTEDNGLEEKPESSVESSTQDD